VKEKEGKLM